ncbi:VWA domain-containing protein [Gilvimarinus sp. SDUM040013]|uniref:VWA domain-containing protein n=1 Tax=Gilvimarinus gilvus TaxID=3058038 RepID=A0ABU4S0L5_9GAMM|nr:VWA domain-containing protein [Gilvimarinus sp. SDUM040013]MDO3385768.1 VWA domain-containing protein [Gilvimarinus sp. SDUM040013]MDX6849408.1 VWA domain-containing protein [Gilvimarinus sp. SDUM040013]
MNLLADFHLLRPLALLALLPLLLAFIGVWLSKRTGSGWQHFIAANLLPYLSENKINTGSRVMLSSLGLFWLLGCIALAGPTWQQAPSEVHQNTDALVVMLDLSPSMVGNDVKPSRLIRARLKIAELLKQRNEGDTALIAYADQAHVVTPLTEDTETIAALLPALHPRMMPAAGSRVETAIDRAVKMLSDAGYSAGSLLLITDGVAQTAETAITNSLANENYRLSILGIGSDKPVPIPAGNGGFMRDSQGNVITTSLHSGRLQRLARTTGGRYATATFNTSDLEYLLAPKLDLSLDQHRLSDNKMDTWLDRGPWLVLAMLPLALLAFRRGVLVLLLITTTCLLEVPTVQAAPSLADNLLLTPNQRGAKALANDQAERAAQEFTDPAWRGTAQYRAGQYEQAAQTFATLDTAQAHYNRGNALAQQGKLDEASAAYDKALQLQPDMQDAAANKALVEQLKQQQQQQNNQESSEQNDSDQADQDKKQQQNQPSTGQSSSGNEETENNQNQGQQNSSSAAGNQPQDDNQPSASQQEQGQSSSSSGNQQERAQASDASSSEAQTAEQQQASLDREKENDQTQEQQLAELEQPMTAEEQEKRQAQEQWLRKIPDDPSGLLRNKFQHEYRKNRIERQFQGLNDFGNEEQRW